MSRLDPRTKIVIVICISAAAMLTQRLWFLVGLLAATVLIMLAMGISVSRQKKQLGTILGMIVFLFVLQAIFGQWELGIILAIRLVILVVSALILITGEPRDYLLAMIQCHMPYELAYMVLLAFHFFPILREEALDIYYSIQLRGTELQKTSLKNKLNAYRKMCFPILAGALERAKDTAIAMEARGFRSKSRRTYLRKLKLKKRDVLLIVLMPLLAAGFAIGAHTWTGPGDEFIVVGDVQYVIRDRDYEEWGDFLGDVYKGSNADFALCLGDMVNNAADEKDWDAFFENERRALGNLKIYTTPGNHETSITPEIYLEKFDLPDNGPLGEEFYSFDYGDCHIVSLNSCIFMKERKGEEGYSKDVEAVHDWLERDLTESNATWKVVFLHHPMYPIAKDSDLYDELRENWEQIFVNAGVDVVFCGHQHAYASSEASGVKHIMSVSGQKPSNYIGEGSTIPKYVETLYEEPVILKVKVHRAIGSNSTLTVEAVNRNGNTVDEYKVEK